MTTKAELYLHALSELENSTGDIISCAIVTLDGLVMASTKSDAMHRETFAAYGAATFKRASETMEEISGETIELLLYESKNQRVVTVRAGEHALLIVLTGRNIQIGMILKNAQYSALKIKEL